MAQATTDGPLAMVHTHRARILVSKYCVDGGTAAVGFKGHG
jgi:hypothetical protein